MDIPADLGAGGPGRVAAPAFVRLVEVPLVATVGTPVSAQLAGMRRGLLGALAAAHTAGRRADVAWIRSRQGGQVQIVVGGELAGWTPRAPDRAPERGPGMPTAYPPGSRATDADPGDLAAAWNLPVWVPCTPAHDSLSKLDTPGRPHDVVGILEDLVGQLGAAPFVWWVSAEPASVTELDDELTELHHGMTLLLDRHNTSGRDAIALERAKERYRELSRASGGTWAVRLLVGGSEQAMTLATARLLSATADLHATSYALSAAETGGPLADAWRLAGERRLIASGELLAAVGRPPVRELPGLRVTEPARFDVSPEAGPVGAGPGIPLGAVLDQSGRAVGELSVPLSTLNRHAFVAGATGAGKSQTVRHVLEGLSAAGVPWLVIEPAKAEYAAMAGRLGPGASVAVIRPGDPEAVPLSLNPLEPAAGFPLQTHLDLVRALFLAAFEANEPFPQVLAQALTRCYTTAGWDLTVGEPTVSGRGRPSYPRLAELQRTAQQVVDEIGYGAQMAADVRGFVDVRMSSLRLGTAGRFLDGGYPGRVMPSV